MPNPTLDIPAPINYIRSPRAKRLRITVHPEPLITVTMPRRASLEEAKRFVASKQKWIAKHLRKMEQQTDTITPGLQQIDLDKAQNDLFNRLTHLSSQHNLPYRRAAFRCQKTKWGSCSPENNISLNINIAFLPTHLQDYILLHELVHIRHKNHSAAFWSSLDRLCSGNAKALSKELKKHRMQIKR